jgi:hypothetical protein
MAVVGRFKQMNYEALADALPGGRAEADAALGPVAPGGLLGSGMVSNTRVDMHHAVQRALKAQQEDELRTLERDSPEPKARPAGAGAGAGEGEGGDEEGGAGALLGDDGSRSATSSKGGASALRRLDNGSVGAGSRGAKSRTARSVHSRRTGAGASTATSKGTGTAGAAGSTAGGTLLSISGTGFGLHGINDTAVELRDARRHARERVRGRDVVLVKRVPRFQKIAHLSLAGQNLFLGLV